ncbi:HlyD family secretion protein [Legionella sp. CNM-1927-20]|uniref:HlyD family secretion protein n=1 Tax=Legionella sp. CNM-1927-20 TaxID=3422221 RepID=UPI00403B1EF0
MTLKFPLVILFTLILLSCSRHEQAAYQGYVEGENIYLASPNSGILIKLAVQRGQLVKKGQFLFELDPNPQALAIKQYQAEITQAEHVLKDLQNPRRTEEITAIEAQIEQVNAQLILAQARLKRYQQLYERRVVAKDVYDEVVARYQELVKSKAQYQANLDLAKQGSRIEQIRAQQAQIQALQARLKEATWQLRQKKLFAPAAGIIFDTYYREGEFVGNQQPVLSLLTPENVHIEFFIPIEQLGNLKVGQSINFTCAGCQPSQAVVNYISPEAEYLPPLVYSRENAAKLVFRIKANMITFNQYKPGQPVTVYLP